jgi:cell division protein FtsB
MKATALLDTQALERVFTEELAQRKLIRQQRRMIWLSVFIVSTMLLLVYGLTPLSTIIR